MLAEVTQRLRTFEVVGRLSGWAAETTFYQSNGCRNEKEGGSAMTVAMREMSVEMSVETREETRVETRVETREEMRRVI